MQSHADRDTQPPLGYSAAPLRSATLSAAWRRFRLPIASLLLLVLGACATIAPPPSSNAANSVLFRAISLVGTPYKYGGNSPTSGFDCSGLVDYVFRTEAGIVLPRTSREIAAVDAPKISRDDLQPGDLLFFGRRHRVNHVAIYVGNGRFVNAPDTGGTVRLDHLDGYYWRDHYLFAKRVLTPRARAALAAD